MCLPVWRPILPDWLIVFRPKLGQQVLPIASHVAAYFVTDCADVVKSELKLKAKHWGASGLKAGRTQIPSAWELPPSCGDQPLQARDAEFLGGLLDRARVDRLRSVAPAGLGGGVIVFHRYRDIGKSTVATARRPVLVIWMRLTSITRPSVRTTSSGVVVARPARTNAVIVLRTKP